MQRYEFSEGKSSKFWEVEATDNKLIKEKTGKGYAEVHDANAISPATAKPVKVEEVAVTPEAIVPIIVEATHSVVEDGDASQTVLTSEFHEQGIGHYRRGKLMFAFQSWQQGAVVGCLDSMWQIFDSLYLDGDVEFEDIAPVIEMARIAAMHDFRRASVLSEYYFDGEKYFGIPSDPVEGLFWAMRAAEKSANLAEKLGNRYAEGNGLPASQLDALHWWEHAASMSGGSAGSLGDRYKKGRFLAKNEEMAVQWWRRGAEMGDINSMNQLAMAHASGQGALVDHAMALHWWERTAALSPDYAFKLGERYQSGRQMQKNEALAIQWWKQAAEAGHQGAALRLERLGIK